MTEVTAGGKALERTEETVYLEGLTSVEDLLSRKVDQRYP